MSHFDDFQHDVDQLTAELNHDNLVEFLHHHYDEHDDINAYESTNYEYRPDAAIYNATGGNYDAPSTAPIVFPRPHHDDHGGADATPGCPDVAADRR